MVGQHPLEVFIGVRIPVGQHTRKDQALSGPFSYLVQKEIRLFTRI